MSATHNRPWVIDRWAGARWQRRYRGGPSRRDVYRNVRHTGFTGYSYDTVVAEKYHLTPFRPPVELTGDDCDDDARLLTAEEEAANTPVFSTQDGTRVCVVANPETLRSPTTRKHAKWFADAAVEYGYKVILVDLLPASRIVGIVREDVCGSELSTVEGLLKCHDYMRTSVDATAGALRAVRAEKGIKAGLRRAKLYRELTARLGEFRALSEFLSQPAPTLVDLEISERAERKNLKICESYTTARAAKKGKPNATDTGSPA